MKEKVLILGGTEFVGRLLVEVLKTDRTKEIYLFNRGKTNPGLFPEIKRILGDRETHDVKKLQAHQWDYVIDFSSYYPKSLKRTLDQINRNIKKYIYISTVSIYDLKDYVSNSEINEDFKKLSCSAAEAVDKTRNTYGKKKIACEEILKETKWLNAIILRPSIIYGKYDPTDRFYYWLRRIKKSNEIIIPDNGDVKLSLTYADDLVAIILKGIKDNLHYGAYNCNTHSPIALRTMLETMKALLGSTCQLFGIDSDRLKKEGCSFPILSIGNLRLSNSRIKEDSGMKFISFEDSVKQLIQFYEREGWRACDIGMEEDQEARIIEKNK